MAGDKRELILDLLARDKSGPGTKSFGKNIKDVGDAADKADDKLGKFSESTLLASKGADDLGDESEQAARRLSKLDREIAITAAELKVMARQFADTADAAERLDISKGIRKGEADIRRLTKSKTLLSDVLPDPKAGEWIEKLGGQLKDGFEKFKGTLAPIGGTIAAAILPGLAAGLSATAVGVVGLAGIGAGVALVAKDPAIVSSAKAIGSKFSKEVQGSARDAFLGPVLDSLDTLGQAADRAAPKIGKIFETVAPSLDHLTGNVSNLSDSLLDDLTYAAGKSGSSINALGDLLEHTGESIGNLIAGFADNADVGAKAIHDLDGILQTTIGDVGVFVGALAKVYDVGSTVNGKITELTGGFDLFKQLLPTAPLQNLLDTFQKSDSTLGTFSSHVMGATESTNKLADSQTAAQRAADGHRTALSELSKELLAESDPVFGLMDAEDQLAAAQKNAAEAAKEHGKKSRESDAALRQLAEAAINVEGKAGSLAATFDGKMTPAMRHTLETAGLTKAEIDRLGKQFGAAKRDGDSFAKTYKANVKVDGTETAAARVRHVRDLLNQVHSKRVSVSVLVADSQLDKVANTLNRFGGARAGGGPTAKDVPYWVGENGPELFVPQGNGRVLSSAQSKNAVNHGHSTSGLRNSGGGNGTIQLQLVGQAELVTMFRYLVRTANLLQDS